MITKCPVGQGLANTLSDRAGGIFNLAGPRRLMLQALEMSGDSLGLSLTEKCLFPEVCAKEIQAVE